MPIRYGQIVTPVYRETDTGIEHDGSAILIQSSHKRWLFASTHGLIGPSRLFLPGRPYFPILREPLVYSPDPLDTAFAELSDSTAEMLVQNGCSFLPHDRIELTPPMGGSRCMISGYPARSVEIDQDARQAMVDPTFVETRFFSEQAHSGLGPDRGIQVAAKVDQLRGPNREKLRNFDWHGLSGGAIWSAPKEAEPKLVGIVTQYDPARKAIIGTRLGPLIREIARRLSAEYSPGVQLPKGYIDRHPERGPWLPIGPIPVGHSAELLLEGGIEASGIMTANGWIVGENAVTPLASRPLRASANAG